MKSSTIGLGLSFGQNLSRNEHLLPHKKNLKKNRSVDQQGPEKWTLKQGVS